MLVRFDHQNRLYKALRLIGPIHLNLNRVMNQALSKKGLTETQFRILEVICENEPMTVQALARNMSMTRRSVQRVVVHLSTDGLLARTANPKRAGSWIFTPTQAGRELCQNATRLLAGLLGQEFGDINITELVVTLRLLNRIASTLEMSDHEDRGIAQTASA